MPRNLKLLNRWKIKKKLKGLRKQYKPSGLPRGKYGRIVVIRGDEENN